MTIKTEDYNLSNKLPEYKKKIPNRIILSEPHEKGNKIKNQGQQFRITDRKKENAENHPGCSADQAYRNDVKYKQLFIDKKPSECSKSHSVSLYDEAELHRGDRCYVKPC